MSSRRDRGKVDVLKKRKNLRKKKIYINQKGMPTAKDFFFVDSSLFDTQNDVNKSEPVEIWLQLINNIIIPH